MPSEEKRSDQERVLGEPATLSGLVSFQEGSVVSMTLADKSAGTITLFAFDEGQGLSEHTAPYDAFVHVLEGEALITVSGRDSRVRAGEMIVMPADEPHALAAPTRFKMLLTMIRS
jgi:quercetin dioxygenase-like cupin family protein